jgi:hypothetical protein
LEEITVEMNNFIIVISVTNICVEFTCMSKHLTHINHRTNMPLREITVESTFIEQITCISYFADIPATQISVKLSDLGNHASQFRDITNISLAQVSSELMCSVKYLTHVRDSASIPLAENLGHLAH